MLSPGIRVIRGFDWEWGNQDGGPGGVGTVSEIGMPGSKCSPDKTVVVNWDCGIRSNYRVGYLDRYDLLVIDNAQCGVRHPNIECHSCKENPVVGIRYKCLECYDVNLCSLCYHDDKHETKHVFARCETAVSQGVKLSARSGEPRVCAKGIFAGAVVVRGHNWKWNLQDGGEGRTGMVTKIKNWGEESQRSVACVTWQTGYKNDYRVGHKGLIDLKCVTPSVGGNYYFKHLPILGKKCETTQSNAAEQMPVPPQMAVQPTLKFRAGQCVRVMLDVDTLKSMQQGHGGWNPRMVEYIGKVGIVHRTTDRGDVRVQYEGCPNRWTFHPGALELAGPLISKNDTVQLIFSQPDKHKLNGRNARVLEVYPDGNAKVQILKETTLVTLPLSSLRLVKANEESIERKPELEKRSCSENNQSQADQPELRLLMSKVAQGNLEYVLQVKEKNTSLLDTPYCGKTAVQVAAYQGHAALVKALLAAGSRPAAPDDDGDTALHDAAFGNQPEILELLLAHPDVDINMRNRSKCTALHIAAHKCLPHCVAVLLKHNADVNVQDAYGDTPLHDAVNAVCGEPPAPSDDNSPMSAAQRIIKMLCEVPNVDLYIRNKRGFNVLQHAALKGAWAACSTCVTACPALVHVPKYDGFMPLHLAALNGHIYAVHALAVVGNANLDVRNNRQQTALLLALSQGHVMVAELLSTLGGDVTLSDEDKNTALHVAVMKRANIIANHESVGNKFGAKFCQKIWQIHESMAESNLGQNRILAAVLLFLVQKGCPTDAANKDGKTYDQLFDDRTLAQTIKDLMSNTRLEAISSEEGVERTLAGICLQEETNSNCLQTNSSRESAFGGAACDNSNASPYRTINYNLNELGSCSNSPMKKQIPVANTENSKTECVVCCESNDENCQFEPCGHKIACEDCAARMKKCLTCFTVIERRISSDGRDVTSKRAPSADRLRYLESKIQEIEDTQCCSICMERRRSVAFLCGHTACGHCARTLSTCHMCRQPIQAKINLY